jgi:hypothetical protein
MERIGLVVLLITTLYISLSQAQTVEPQRQSNEKAWQFVSAYADKVHSGILQKEVFRGQIKVLAITIFFVLVGIALSKDAQDLKGSVLLIAVVSVAFLYGMDTSLLDLSKRQDILFRELNGYLMRWDKLDVTGVDSALVLVKTQSDSSRVHEKLSLAFCNWRTNDQPWYILPVVVGSIIWYLKKRKKQGTRH